MKKYILASLICISTSTLLLFAPLEERFTQPETGVTTFSKPRQPEISVAQKEEAALAISAEPRNGARPPENHGNVAGITYKNKTDLINTIQKQITDQGGIQLTSAESAALAQNLPASESGDWNAFDIELDKILTKRDVIINHQQFINDLHAAESKTGILATWNRTMDSINLTIAKLFNNSTLGTSTHSATRGYTIHSTPQGKPAPQEATTQQSIDFTTQLGEDGYYTSPYDNVTGFEPLDPRIATGFSQPAPAPTRLTPQEQNAQAAQDRSAQDLVANLRELGIIDTPASRTEAPVAPARRSTTATAQPEPKTPITINKATKQYVDAIVPPIRTISDLSTFTQKLGNISDRTIALQAIGSKVFNLTGQTSLEEIQAKIMELGKAIQNPSNPSNQALINRVLKNMSVPKAPVSISGTASTSLAESNILNRTQSALGYSKPEPAGENEIHLKLADFVTSLYHQVENIAFVENSPVRKAILAKQAAAKDAAARQAVLGGLRTQAPSRAEAPVTPPTQRPTVDTGSPLPSDSSGAFPISGRAEDPTLRATSIDGSDNAGYPPLGSIRTSFEGTLDPAYNPDSPEAIAAEEALNAKLNPPAPKPLTRWQKTTKAVGNVLSPRKPTSAAKPLSQAELKAQVREQNQSTIRSAIPKADQAAQSPTTPQSPALDAQTLVSNLQDLGFADSSPAETPVQRGQRVFGGKRQASPQPATPPIIDGQYAGVL